VDNLHDQLLAGVEECEVEARKEQRDAGSTSR
jgi:hypothetical protein